MRRYLKFSRWLFLMGSLAVGLTGITVYADASLEQSGTVSVIDGGASLQDPENPEVPTDPGPGTAESGPLRIDYVSPLHFGERKIRATDRVYPALAQQFFTEIGPRGSYVQLTDQRALSTGWSLQVKQETQFHNPIIQETGEQELKGAVLSLDKGWANSSSSSEAPVVTRETIALNTIGSTYEVATAAAGTGQGVWTISFGASDTNTGHQKPTLTPVKDEAGRPILEKEFNKPAYQNSAITLTIPETTVIHPVHYETKITWLLAELP
ncbi:WxL domain-containing protein [Enterococcus rotai]|uniref:WxL domain-containing protein n=1 Tax=Enterococcus rotai TaxID=118060 RepID=UPI0032B57630